MLTVLLDAPKGGFGPWVLQKRPNSDDRRRLEREDTADERKRDTERDA